ncbi:hypothetical protein M2352_000580 [Azospirillum fermentarium]|uniref:hypothetical protein n=1 Tax=Azospirillum fermentarium TaxID=1233114 RepID=UPI0022280125|nr:hypothetical protein [Azospirillum fermentarium]MCW2244989.1 hypothetical protein [Azospirillum fermentarium]
MTGANEPCPVLPTTFQIPGLDYTGLDANQTQFDNFSWQLFVALNWPADKNGQPVGTLAQGSSAKRVWEYFPTTDEVFGSNNGGGCTSHDLPTFSSIAKSGSLTQAASQSPGTEAMLTALGTQTGKILQATGQPLIDRNGNYVLYDIRVSVDEKTYIQNNGLTTQAGQEKYGKDIVFPAADEKKIGALEIKTSWRILPEPDSGYYTIKAQISLGANETENGKPACLPVTLGLVGMHIMAKPSAGYDVNSWTWSTIEHRSNAPLATGAPQPVDGNHPVPSVPCSAVAPTSTAFSFYNPSCTSGGKACPLNTPPAKPAGGYKWNTSGPPYAPASLLYDGKYGTQAARCWAVFQPTDALNTLWAAKLEAVDPAGPWKNYFVVSTQWVSTQVHGNHLTFDQRMVPRYLSNVTMETYIQPDGSCMSCHKGAPDLAKKDANFSFFLLNGAPGTGAPAKP